MGDAAGRLRAGSIGPSGSPPLALPIVSNPNDSTTDDAVDFSSLRVNGNRLHGRLAELATIGPIEGGGVSRLALTDDDRAGRDLVVTWMRDLGLDVSIDGIGNVWAIRPGTEDGPAVMCGSHIDTVRTGGKFDGNLGVLAGLEVIEALAEADITTRRPIGVAFFTNEEGARFAPDMMGSLVYVGGMGLEETLDVEGIDGCTVGAELDRIGYRGTAPSPGPAPHAFVELHIEQGPVLEAEGITIGAVSSVQGISWTEVTIEGQSNHAGTTPMALRHDPGYVASAIATFVRELALDIGHPQVGTVGRIELHPNLVNVVAARAVCTVDLRNTDDALLQQAEERLATFLTEIAEAEGVTIRTRSLARFEPVVFDDRIVSMVSDTATRLGHTVMTMPSGAGHDAQMMARVAPSAMVFTPSRDGISHNPAEFTEPHELEAGANVMMQVMLQLTEQDL